MRGAVAIAERFHLPTALIGLTVVAYGTSAPELVVSVQAGATGSPDIALGNVIGSNISNILLVLGMTAMISAIPVCKNTIRRDGWLMIFCTLLLFAMCADGQINRLEALVLCAGAVSYGFYAYRSAKKRPILPAPHMLGEQKHCTICAIAYLTVGLGLLTTGADILIDGAAALARAFQVSEAVIGLTIVAIGSSAPELATSVVAAWRKKPDLSVANIIGSNIFNILGIIGISALITPLAVSSQFLGFDLYALLGISALGLMMLYTDHTLTRKEGTALVALYLAYGIYQYLFTSIN